MIKTSRATPKSPRRSPKNIADAVQEKLDATPERLARAREAEIAVRSVMGLSLLRSVEGDVGRSEARTMRPGYRLALIDAAVSPFASELGAERVRRLRTSLTAVIAAEMLVALKDHCDSSDEEVIETVIWTARAVVEAALTPPSTHSSRG